MPRLLTVEFCVGTALGLVLYVLDRSGKSNAYITSSFLILIAGFLIHPALNIPWVWSPPNKAMKVWRGSAVVGLILVAVSWFGIWTWPESAESHSSLRQVNLPKTAPIPELNSLPPTPQAFNEAVTRKLDLRVSALGIEYDQEKRELVAHFMFRNEGTMQRTVLSLTFIYWDPNRTPEKSYQILSSSETESMALGDVKPIAINAQTEQILTCRRIIGLPYFAKVGGKIGIRINTTDPNGAVKTKELELMEIQKIALIGDGVSYIGKRVENVPLDK